MPILKFRVFFEEDDTIYRDIAIFPTDTFQQLHLTILKAFEFDNKHAATFYRSNENWQRGREISLEVYEKEYKAPPLLMEQTAMGSEIKNLNQRFVYVYDFTRNWTFLIELIGVSKEENPKLTYPAVTRAEGIPPSQYGTKSLLGDKFADIEEKYDLSKAEEGFGEKDEEGEDVGGEEEGLQDEESDLL